jgi:flagellar export protein FliJ
MSISPALGQLLRIRKLEEEQSRIALETALGELNRLKAALVATAQGERAGRRLIASSVRSGILTDRIAGLQEMDLADKLETALTRKLAKTEPEVARLRERFLSTRVQRRQAESVIKENKDHAQLEEERRNQRNLDDLHRTRSERKRVERDDAQGL